MLMYGPIHNRIVGGQLPAPFLTDGPEIVRDRRKIPALAADALRHDQRAEIAPPLEIHLLKPHTVAGLTEIQPQGQGQRLRQWRVRQNSVPLCQPSVPARQGVPNAPVLDRRKQLRADRTAVKSIQAFCQHGIVPSFLVLLAGSIALSCIIQHPQRKVNTKFVHNI